MGSDATDAVKAINAMAAKVETSCAKNVASENVAFFGTFFNERASI